MIELPRRTLIIAGIVVLILIGINLFLRPDLALQVSPTSFGLSSVGYKAAFDLAAELGFPVTRSYANPRHDPPTDQLWMVSPSMLDPDASAGDSDARDLLQWIHAGGTAIVLGGDDSDWNRLGIEEKTYAGTDHAALSGAFASTMRRVAVAGLLHFAAAPKDAEIRLRADDDPFALERKVGQGRLIAIADDRFMRNADLGDADNSLLFVDLMRRFDRARFDEHCHGMVGDISLYAAVAESRVRLPIGVGLMLALVWMLAQNRWPRRTADRHDELPSPTIEPFVESIGVLYARAADPQAAFRAYRDGFLRRLRRQMVPFGAPDEAVVLQRIARDRSLSEATRRWLIDPSAPKNNAELVEAIRAIEAYAGIVHG